MPPWEFVVDLFADLATDRGTPATPLTLDHVRELHRCAVRAGVPPADGVRVLHKQLADADREARRATAQEDVLGDAQLDRRHRIADLDVRLDLPEAQWTAERVSTRSPAAESGSAEVLLAERGRLEDQVRALEADLAAPRSPRRTGPFRSGIARVRCSVLTDHLA